MKMTGQRIEQTELRNNKKLQDAIADYITENNKGARCLDGLWVSVASLERQMTRKDFNGLKNFECHTSFGFRVKVSIELFGLCN